VYNGTTYAANETMVNWWKGKAVKRYKTLLSQNRLNDSILYYGCIKGMDWNQVKEKFIGDLGR
jgi:hypothetical protein